MNSVLSGYDTLDVLGTALGVYVAIAALGTLVGMPWQYADGAGVMVVQAGGSVLAFVLAVAFLALLHRT
ncbi:hypothetical protein EFA46_003295 [Halarchaeum sp. CBA1220]|uniref:DUF8123 domain-containing protein n=1 Tax=Halarchaeum grantii TaxID=1193105 RepID=A0A830F0T4_9EURY|nr:MULTISPECIES: hypothetical protein [Halarchaeum]QLC33271.1 hypothetical protein EFA46_003295 [Halarchaeum sp. CBA1220]GGL29175.1 hypothetical protein GCM10009037_11100 [Halarchaeum grantii]